MCKASCRARGARPFVAALQDRCAGSATGRLHLIGAAIETKLAGLAQKYYRHAPSWVMRDRELSMTQRVTETPTEKLYERFPHLRKIDLLWGSPECRKFVFMLMTDTRGGTRAGFPREHAATIMSLLLEHDRKFPQFENEIGHNDHRWGFDAPRRGGR
jgi:hypothetical protein